MATVLYWYDEDPPFLTHEIRFGAITAENHEDLVTITEHPVEAGSSTSDHARQEPPRITIEGVVSTVISAGMPGTTQAPRVEQMPQMVRGPDRPESHQLPKPPIQPDAAGLVGAAIGAITGAAKPLIIKVPTYRLGRTPVTIPGVERITPGDRPREVYEQLLEAKGKNALVTVATRFREYFDMMFERITLLRTAEDGTSGRFQIDLKRVRIASTETVEAPIPAEARGAAGRNRGAQATKPADTPGASQMRSTLHELFF